MQYQTIKIAPRNRLKKHRTNTDNNTFIGIFIALSAFITLGLIGHSDYQYAQLKQASITCQNQMTDTTPTFDQCVNNQLERNNDKWAS